MYTVTDLCFLYIRIDICKMYSKCLYTKCISHFDKRLYTKCIPHIDKLL